MLIDEAMFQRFEQDGAPFPPEVLRILLAGDAVVLGILRSAAAVFKANGG